MLNRPDNCPHCGKPLQGNPIPIDQRALFGDATHFRREVGVEVQGVYDGVLYWECPDCEGMWNRWPADDPRFKKLHDAAEWEMMRAW